MATSSAMMGGRMTENMAGRDLKEPKMSRPLLLQSRPQSRTGSSVPARSATGGRQEGCDGADEALQRTADDWMAATTQEAADGSQAQTERTSATRRARQTGSA